MTAPGLVEAIRSAPCGRVALPHPECVAAAVATWIEGVLDDLMGDEGDDHWNEAIQAVRRRLVGDPQDLDLEPEGRT